MPSSKPATPPDSPWISAEEAATLLGVKRASLYSYVSRGLLRAQRLPQQKGSSYLLSDVTRLARQRAAIRNPAKVAQSALDWGQAVLPSAITRVSDGQFFYRGRNAVELAEHASLEDVAALLWQCEPTRAPKQIKPPVSPRSGEPLPNASQVLTRWFDMATSFAKDATATCEAQMPYVHAMCSALLGQPFSSEDCATPIHQRLQRHWQLTDDAADLLRRALVLCADHELNASTFAVRVVASTGASLHASLGAGLAALSGPKHGGMAALIDQHWDDWHASSRDTGGLASSLQQLLHETQIGQTPSYCAGFGHPLYPQGDPRSSALLATMPTQPEVQSLTAKVLELTGLHPSLDYTLVAIQRSLQLPRGTAFVLFALGRSVGWMAHAQEQVASGQLIRPRAVYPVEDEHVSSPPGTSTHDATRRLVRFR